MASRNTLNAPGYAKLTMILMDMKPMLLEHPHTYTEIAKMAGEKIGFPLNPSMVGGVCKELEIPTAFGSGSKEPVSRDERIEALELRVAKLETRLQGVEFTR